MRKIKASITMESAILFAIVCAGILATQAYFRGSLQANWRGNSDAFSDEQFRPGHDPVTGKDDANPSIEKTGGLEIVNPTIKVDINLDGSTEKTYSWATEKSDIKNPWGK